MHFTENIRSSSDIDMIKCEIDTRRGVGGATCTYFVSCQLVYPSTPTQRNRKTHWNYMIWNSDLLEVWKYGIP